MKTVIAFFGIIAVMILGTPARAESIVESFVHTYKTTYVSNPEAVSPGYRKFLFPPPAEFPAGYWKISVSDEEAREFALACSRAYGATASSILRIPSEACAVFYSPVAATGGTKVRIMIPPARGGLY